MSLTPPPKLVKILETRHGPMLAVPNDVYITKCLEAYGELSPAEWKLLAQIIKPGMVVIEVGANIGAHTVPMARACRPGPMYAFEPQRRIFQILCANLALNDVDNVVASQEACGAEAGHARIPPLNYANTGNFGGVSLQAEDAAGERVRVVRLDDLGAPSCGLIKIDVEGFEAEVIAGAAELIQRCRPILYVENDRAEHQRMLIALIDQLGYRMYWHTPQLVEAENYRGLKELVLDKNYVSLNMLCLPKERTTGTDLEAVDPADPKLPVRFGSGPVGGEISARRSRP